MTQLTPLNSAHRDMGAKMVDFSGWEMPIHYGSQIEEHHAVRTRAGMFDVSHMTVVDIRGAHVVPFLHNLLANNVDKLTQPGKALYSCMLDENGGVIDDLIVYFMRDDWYRLIVNAATREKDLAWITMKSASFDVAIAQKTGVAMIAVQGPHACETVQKVMPINVAEAAKGLTRFSAADCGDWFVARTGYTGEDGYELVIPNDNAESIWRSLADEDVKPVGLGARDTLRLEAGMALYGNDLDEQHTPLESGLAWTVAMQPESRDFIGRAALQAQLDNGVNHKMAGLVLEGRGVLRGHQKLQLHGEPVGEITSGTFSPTLSASIAIARLKTGMGVAVEGACEVDIRGKLVPARVVNYPFVKNGQAT